MGKDGRGSSYCTFIGMFVEKVEGGNHIVGQQMLDGCWNISEETEKRKLDM